MPKCIVGKCKNYSCDFITKKCHAHSDNCTICLDKLGTSDDTATMLCGHHFHATCIYNWLNNGTTCPLCREHKYLKTTW